MQNTLVQKLASLVQAVRICEKSGNEEWRSSMWRRAEKLVRAHLPHGSGFDSGTVLDWDRSSPEKLVFRADFHHMDDNGFYCGWSEHYVTVRAHLAFGFTVSVSGRNKRDIKEYISEVFHSALSATIEN